MEIIQQYPVGFVAEVSRVGMGVMESPFEETSIKDFKSKATGPSAFHQKIHLKCDGLQKMGLYRFTFIYIYTHVHMAL